MMQSEIFQIKCRHAKKYSIYLNAKYCFQITCKTVEVDEGDDVLIDHRHLFAETLIHKRFSFRVGSTIFLAYVAVFSSNLLYEMLFFEASGFPSLVRCLYNFFS